jgi:hypothetical protein
MCAAEVIGSVRWTGFKGASSTTLTTDDGKLYLVDLRLAKNEPALKFDFGKLDMFAHEHYAENHVLLGYADGELKHIDLRMSGDGGGVNGGQQDVKLLHSVQDPYVDIVGNIHYCAGSMIVTGYTEYVTFCTLCLNYTL